jgi:zinc protease
MDILPGGLSVIVEPVHGAPVVALQVWVRSGGFDEREGERGLAHLHEHMLFKGTPTRGVGEIASAIEACGGDINAWTSHDHTCYHATLPAADWREGLAVLADAVCHPLFEPTELAREIEVVVEEIKRAADSPAQVGHRRLCEQAFVDHPYARPVLGTAEAVRAMRQEDMRAFWRRHYVTGNTLVVVAGDIDMREARAEVARLFADLPLGPAPDRPVGAAPLPPAHATVLASGFSESRCTWAWPIPALDHPDVPALDVLALVLGQGDSSRLVQRVQRELRLANDIGASSWTPLRAGLFSVTLLASPEQLADARRATLDCVAELCRRGVTAAEVAKARNNVLADATYKLEAVQGMAHALGYFAASTGDPHWDRRYEAAVAAVTPAEVVRVARAYLAPEQVQVVLLPGQASTDGLDGAALLGEVRTAWRALAVPSLAVRTPDVVDGIERIELPGGDVLVVQPDRSVPVLGLRVAAAGGLRGEAPATNGRAHLAASLWTRGTARRSSAELAHEIETLAAGLGGVAGRSSVGLHAVSLASTREAVLDLLLDTTFHADLPETELEQERASQLEELRHQSDTPARLALRTMVQTLYGEHPYGLDLLGQPDSVGRLTRTQLLDWSRRQLAPGGLVWSAAGDVDPAELADAIAARTPDDRTPLPVVDRLPVAPLSEVVARRLHADKAQAHVAIGFVGTTLYDRDRHALEVLTAVLSGQSGRLFLELRDRQSLAYTVSAMHGEGVDEGYVGFYIGTSPDKVGRALDGLYAQIDAIRQAPVTADELQRALRGLAGGHAIGLQRRSTRAALLGLNELYGLGRSEWQGHLHHLRAVTADDVLRVAQRYLSVGRHVEVVLAPGAT